MLPANNEFQKMWGNDNGGEKVITQVSMMPNNATCP
jgi:hypothetical protein